MGQPKARERSRCARGSSQGGSLSIGFHNDRHSYYLTLTAWARNLEGARRELCARYAERVFRLFQIYLWAGAHLHRDGGLEAYRAVFQKARGRPSAGLGVRGPR